VRHTLFLSVLICCCITAFSQGGKLSGLVLDSSTNTPLELATVTILGHDSSVVAYQLSGRDGKFSIEKLPAGRKLHLNVSYSGYIPFNKAIQLDAGKKDTISVYLTLKNNNNDAIVVTTTVPIRMNGDTLELNPAAFKMKENAVVEELLNQVPGITIWSDGSITVNGKPVQTLLVDGKPFMGSSDTRVATQNIPKAAIEKIQLYQEYDRSNMGQESKPTDSLLTMNIRLKEKAKKGYFGKAGAGYGSFDRFESDLSFQVYNKNSSLGVGGGFNNINKSIGNLQELFQNNTYRNYNPNLYSVGRFGTSGINKNYSVGSVYTHSFIETANSRQNNRIVINYNRSGTDAYITDVTLQNRTALNNPQFIRDDGVQNNQQERNNLGINYVRTNSYNDNLNVNGTAGSSIDRGNSSRSTEVRDSANLLQSTNAVTGVQSRRSDNESASLEFSRSDFEEPLRGFNLQMNANRTNSRSEQESKSIFESFTDMTRNSSKDRHYSTNNQSVIISGNFDYTGFKRLLLGRYNLFGMNLNLSQRVNYSRTSDDSRVTDYDSTTRAYILNDNISNSNKRELYEYTPVLGFSKSINKNATNYYKNIGFTVRGMDEMKTDKNLSSFAKRSLSRSFRFFRYEGTLYYQYQRKEKYFYFVNANYSKNFDYPSVDQLYTITDDINVYDTRIGNPLLRNRTNHNYSVSGNFNTQNQKAIYNINTNVNASYNRSVNPVADSIINDFSGKRLYYYVNAPNSEGLSLNYNFNISRKLKKNNLQLMYNGQFSSREVPNYIDGVHNISTTGNLSNQVNLQFSLNTLLVLTMGEALQLYQTKQTATGLKSFSNHSGTTKLGAVLNYPTNFTFSSTLDYVTNSNLQKPNVLWNAFGTYRFMKQQGELKFSAMDILKQYQNIMNSVSSYGTITRVTNGLQQYFLLTFSYYPRKFGKPENKKEMN
jgi:hypothetical protein